MVGFTADCKELSISVRKSRVWTLNFYHFLTFHQIVAENTATSIPYLKIKKTAPQFLILNEYNRLIRHFRNEAQSLFGLYNISTTTSPNTPNTFKDK